MSESFATLGRLISFVVCAVLAIAVTGDSAQLQAAEPGTCQTCHAGGLPLPDKHPKLKSATIAECATCHTSQSGQAKAQPVVARLHRAHAKLSLDCATCHTYSAGKGFGVIGRKGNLTVLDDEQYERVRKAMESWTNSRWLAATHGNKNISCGACHQKQLIPDDNETVLNKQCVTCHGNYNKLATLTKTKLKNPNINPHASHLGPQIACTVCHQGHQESQVYCLNCHTNFNMPIPGGADKAAPAAAK